MLHCLMLNWRRRHSETVLIHPLQARPMVDTRGSDCDSIVRELALDMILSVCSQHRGHISHKPGWNCRLPSQLHSITALISFGYCPVILRIRGHLPAPIINGEEIASENGRISDFRGLVTLTLDRVIVHTVMHHSSTSTYIPNFTEIE